MIDDRLEELFEGVDEYLSPPEGPVSTSARFLLLRNSAVSEEGHRSWMVIEAFDSTGMALGEIDAIDLDEITNDVLLDEEAGSEQFYPEVNRLLVRGASS